MGETNPKPPVEDKVIIEKMASLVVVFVPSILAIFLISFKYAPSWILPVLAILNLLCSAVGSVGLVRGLKHDSMKFLLVCVLVPFFFLLNVLIVIFIGCSGQGGFAP
jgi:hypothetical protein